MADRGKSDDEQATKDLLAGFDRTGRSPRAPGVRRDFVDFHAGPTPRGAETVLVTRSRRAGLVPWLVVAFVASALFALIVWLALLPRKPHAPTAIASVSASAVALPVASSPALLEAPAVGTAPSTPSAPSAPPSVAPVRSALAPAPSVPARPKEEPRVDFVRKL